MRISVEGTHGKLGYETILTIALSLLLVDEIEAFGLDLAVYEGTNGTSKELFGLVVARRLAV